MSKIPQLTQGGVERQVQEVTNWKQCIICQSVDLTKGTLVTQVKLDSYKKLLDAVQERADLHDGNFVEIQR